MMRISCVTSAKHGRRVKVRAQLRQTFPARQHARALSAGVFHLRFHILQLAFVDQRADVSLGIHAVAHSQLPGLAHASFEKRLVQAAVHVAALDRKAGLSRR